MKIIAYYENPDGSKPTAELNIAPNIFVHFRRCDDYDGGFGFDWMRDEYIYTTKDLKENLDTDEWEEVSRPPVCQMKGELKKQYKQMYESLKKPYYIPWLSMFPNHENRTGEKVRLQLKVEIMDPKWKKSKVKFDCPPGIRISPAEIELTIKDIIDQNAKGRKEDIYRSTTVEILCDSPHAGGEVIIKTITDKNNPVEKEVGKLTLFRNDKEYPLKIRIVKFIRKGYKEIDKRLFDEQTSDIVKYIKSKSLQQAMIVPEVEVVKEITIDEQQWKAKGSLVEIDDPEDYAKTGKKVLAIAGNRNNAFVRKYRDVFEYEEEEVKCEEYEEHEEFKAARKDDKYEGYGYVYENGEAENGIKKQKKRTPYIGIVVLLTNIYSESFEIGGIGSFHPTQDNECLITRAGFTKNLFQGPYFSSISHEIGHALGLHHTFEDYFVKNDLTDVDNENREKRTKQYIEKLPVSITALKQYIKEKNEYIKMKERYIKFGNIENAKACEENIKNRNEAIKAECQLIIYAKEYIPRNTDIIESYYHFKNMLNMNYYFAFNEGYTDNFMDYTKNFQKHSLFNSFFCWQWIIMQKDMIYHQSKNPNK